MLRNIEKTKKHSLEKKERMCFKVVDNNIITKQYKKMFQHKINNQVFVLWVIILLPYISKTLTQSTFLCTICHFNRSSVESQKHVIFGYWKIPQISRPFRTFRSCNLDTMFIRVQLKWIKW
jgi:hypothetical protein